jgi:hypothetical protein
LLGIDAAPMVEAGFEADEVTRSVTNHLVVTMSPDGTATINDCMLVSPPGTTGMAYWYDGTASTTGNGAWVIDTIELQSRTGCIPATLAAEVLAGYSAFWEARAEYWNPPDPDHPGVSATMTGPHLERIRDLLGQHQRDGWHAINTVAGSHPEIYLVEEPDQVVVLDCQLAAPERGIFDADGNRQPGLDAPAPGQRDIFQVRLAKEEGQWKVSDVQVQEAVACQFAPTPDGVPQV